MRTFTRAASAAMFLTIAMGGACREGGHTPATNLAQNKLDALAGQLAGGGVVKLRILQVPGRVLTRTRLTPEMLEKQFDYELTIRDLRGNAYERELLDSLRSTVVDPQSEMPDLRWGVIFYDASGRPLAAVYFDSTGKRGAVDGLPVSFRGRLFGWLNGGFSACFR